MSDADEPDEAVGGFGDEDQADPGGDSDVQPAQAEPADPPPRRADED